MAFGGRQAKARSAGRGEPAGSAAVSARTRVVWTALLGAMTGVTGLLLLVGGERAPELDGGWNLAPLVSVSAASGVEAAFRTDAPLAEGRWTTIVIHGTGDLSGSAASIDAAHRSMGLSQLGYHFVIGNGRRMGDGEVHVGGRWMHQLPGAHVAGAAGAEMNLDSIGIALVGDGNRRPYTEAQVRRLLELVTALCGELEIPSSRVLLHSDVAPVGQPGRLFPRAELQERLAALP